MDFGYEYRILDQDILSRILADKIGQVEAEHFKLSIEARLLGVLGIEDERQLQVKQGIMEREVQLAALLQWAGLEGPREIP